MRLFISIVCFLTFCLTAFSQTAEIQFVQSGKIVDSKSDIIYLEKKDFEILVKFDKKVYEIYLNLSYEDKYFTEKQHPKAPELSNLLFYTVAEHPFNASKKLYLDSFSFHFMGPEFEYKGKKRHNFSTLKQKSGKFIGRKEVAYFDDRKSAFSIKEVEKAVYIYALALKKGEKSSNSLENLKDENVCFRFHKKIEWK